MTRVMDAVLLSMSVKAIVPMMTVIRRVMMKMTMPIVLFTAGIAMETAAMVVMMLVVMISIMIRESKGETLMTGKCW